MSDTKLASVLQTQVEALMDDQKSIMVGYHNNEIDQVPFRKVIKLKKKVDPDHLQMVEILSI